MKPAAMLIDAHIHSRVSPDSSMDPREAVQTLADAGLGCCFTEHVDYVTPAEGRDAGANDAPRSGVDFVADLTAYPKTYRIYQSETVGLGLEIGLTAAYRALNRRAAALEGLDFIIGSIHFVDGFDISRPEYYDFCRETAVDPHRRWLTYTREMAASNDFFHSLGHLDYISRYTPLQEKNIPYAAYPDEYDALFKTLAERDAALEINTARFGDRETELCLNEIFRRFHETGGRYVTIGSDAHRPGKLGRHHARGLRMAREIGLTPVYFKDKKMKVS